MISTLLLDLDHTLLTNDMQTFLPAYLKLLSNHLADLVDPGRMVEVLMTGTQAMLDNMDPTRTLEQVFNQHFYPTLGLDQTTTAARIETFYSQDFGQLENITGQRPAAIRIVEFAFEQGLDVVIATNPLFPKIAVDQRLKWANLPPGDYDFSLISSFEHFHFAKPHPEYFAEILGRLGRSPSEAAMLGDDLALDIHPAHALGLSVFHVGDESNPSFDCGTLEDALTWLQSILNSKPAAINDTPAQLLARLRGHLGALRSMLTDLPDQCWITRLKENEWAAVEIICHMRDVELEINLPRFKAILAQEQPFLSSFDSDRWAEERKYLQQSGAQALEIFTETRLQILAMLEEQSPADWMRKARHAIFGPTSLLEMVSIGLEHDMQHLSQLRRTLKALPSAVP